MQASDIALPVFDLYRVLVRLLVFGLAVGVLIAATLRRGRTFDRG